MMFPITQSLKRVILYLNKFGMQVDLSPNPLPEGKGSKALPLQGQGFGMGSERDLG